MQVYRCGLSVDKDNKASFGPPKEYHLPDEDFNQFKWDKINRLDFVQETGITIIFLSTSLQKLRDLWDGVIATYQILEKPDEILSLNTTS